MQWWKEKRSTFQTSFRLSVAPLHPLQPQIMVETRQLSMNGNFAPWFAVSQLLSVDPSSMHWDVASLPFTRGDVMMHNMDLLPQDSKKTEKNETFERWVVGGFAVRGPSPLQRQKGGPSEQGGPTHKVPRAQPVRRYQGTSPQPFWHKFKKSRWRVTSSLHLFCVLVETAHHAPQGMERSGRSQTDGCRSLVHVLQQRRKLVQKSISKVGQRPPARSRTSARGDILLKCVHWWRATITNLGRDDISLQSLPWTSGSRVWRHSSFG